MELIKFTPPIWATKPHLQTLLGYFLPSSQVKEKGKKHIFDVTGGDQIVSRELVGSSDTVVYLFHGLGGNAQAAYMQRTARIAGELGHTVIMTNHRGCGEGAGLATHPYHSGIAEDLAVVINWGRKKYPHKKHVAIGFSLSANALLLLLTGVRARAEVDYAVTFNAPIDLQLCSQELKNSWNRIYDIKFVNDFRRDLRFRIQKNPELRAYFPKWNSTIYDVDEIYTGKAGGFKNRENYYSTCSTHDKMHLIKTPVLMITAQDDPFVPFASYKKLKLPENIKLMATQYGGHLGYLQKASGPVGYTRWIDHKLKEVLTGFS